jgi:hypothetical protein
MSFGSPPADAWAIALRPLQQLRASWPSRGWSWDGRLSCVSSSFSAELDAKARAIALAAMPREWTKSNAHVAPASIREIAERSGGLRSGQAILAGDGAAFAYGLWWPWGDGMTTSLRIGLGGSEPSQSTLQRLRDVFGVEL